MSDALSASATLCVSSVESADGARAELMLVSPADERALRAAVLWLPAMGVPARHYLALADGLASQGVATAIHEWRGIGSSDRRAGRRSDWGYRELLSQDLAATLSAVRQPWPQMPLVIGGHSLGGQLAALFAAMHPSSFTGLVLVASGSPFWRTFPRGPPIRIAYGAAPLLATLRGYLPGRWLGFAGNEARGVTVDWARSGWTGRYAARGLDTDLEQGLAQLDLPVLGIRFEDDWLVPPGSLEWLLAKLPRATATRLVFGAELLEGRPPDHFAWMKAPAAVAGRIAGWLR
ncbi:alpha/beta hydrolase family protein [Dyella lutea]|uniref:Alpha/beta fold hydrolase n=1 Tax=Dyella lutea TaxID=2950441 RepID=A0ABT1FHI7_9GAMM|nr:alpha/beta fold hydrolase [Dyella lutea]MCP1375588.1 alpha/beta fold hydrolase [Dyella lutea]